MRVKLSNTTVAQRSNVDKSSEPHVCGHGWRGAVSREAEKSGFNNSYSTTPFGNVLSVSFVATPWEIRSRSTNRSRNAEWCQPFPCRRTKSTDYKYFLWGIRVELVNKDCKWGVKFTMTDLCRFIQKWIKWVHDNISKDRCIMVSIRTWSPWGHEASSWKSDCTDCLPCSAAS